MGMVANFTESALNAFDNAPPQSSISICLNCHSVLLSSANCLPVNF